MAYLLADGVQLRSNSGAVRRALCCASVRGELPNFTFCKLTCQPFARRSPSLRLRQLPVRHAVDPFSGDDSAFTPEDEASDEEDEALPSFPEVEAAVNAAIERLGGAVIPKLNWSAPKVRAAAAAVACGA